MKLIIGGYAQGKLAYVLEKYDIGAEQVFDGRLPQKTEKQKGMVIINRFHNWVRQRLADGGHPEEELVEWLKGCPDCIIISDEIGNGIVPIEAFEREYREYTGRILVELAKRAEEVERVICGIGQKLK